MIYETYEISGKENVWSLNPN